MGVYKVKDIWHIDFYADGQRVRKDVCSKKDAEDALDAVKIDILKGKYRFKRESQIRFEDFEERYLEHGKTIKKRSWQRGRWKFLI
jgi:hypothetical protein